MRSAPLAALVLSLASGIAAAADPANFLFTDSDDLVNRPALVERPDVAGVQIVYTWKSLEHAPGEYDFSQIDTDLAFLEKRGRKLFVQLQDRFFLGLERSRPLAAFAWLHVVIVSQRGRHGIKLY